MKIKLTHVSQALLCAEVVLVLGRIIIRNAIRAIVLVSIPDPIV